jgi:hypothetical protein
MASIPARLRRPQRDASDGQPDGNAFRRDGFMVEAGARGGGCLFVLQYRSEVPPCLPPCMFVAAWRSRQRRRSCRHEEKCAVGRDRERCDSPWKRHRPRASVELERAVVALILGRDRQQPTDSGQLSLRRKGLRPEGCRLLVSLEVDVSPQHPLPKGGVSVPRPFRALNCARFSHALVAAPGGNGHP